MNEIQTLVNDADQKLHQITQMNHIQFPVYDIIEDSNSPQHQKYFIATCKVLEHVANGYGCSKKKAKKEAAANMINLLNTIPENVRNLKMSRKRKMQDHVSALYSKSIRDGGTIRCSYAMLAKQPDVRCVLCVKELRAVGIGFSKREAKVNASEEMLRLMNENFGDGSVEVESQRVNGGDAEMNASGETSGVINDNGNDGATSAESVEQPAIQNAQ